MVNRKKKGGLQGMYGLQNRDGLQKRDGLQRRNGLHFEGKEQSTESR